MVWPYIFAQGDHVLQEAPQGVSEDCVLHEAPQVAPRADGVQQRAPGDGLLQEAPNGIFDD